MQTDGPTADIVIVNDADRAEERRLWAAYRVAGTSADRDALITLYMPYAKAVAAKLYGRRYDDEAEFDDYFQLAIVGLMECVDRYDEKRGAQFKTYATTRMVGSILNGIDRISERHQQISLRRRLKASAERLESLADDDLDGIHSEELFRQLASIGVGLALGFLLEDSGMIDTHEGQAASPMSAYDHVALKQLRKRVVELVDRLPERESKVIRYHYLQDIPFTDIAAELGVTKGRVSQIHKRALELLKQELANLQSGGAVW